MLGGRLTPGDGGGGTGQVLSDLQRLSDAALAHLDLEDLLQQLLDRVAEIVHTDTAAILLLEPDTNTLRARAAKGIEEEVEQGVRIPVGRGFAGRIAAERHPVAIPARSCGSSARCSASASRRCS